MVIVATTMEIHQMEIPSNGNDNTQANTNIPQTGINNTVILITIIVLGAISILAFVNIKKSKDIK